MQTTENKEKDHLKKAVMLSIRPKWCNLIARGVKTVEIRKSRPNQEPPFRCYIYCTAGTGKNTFNVPIPDGKVLQHYVETGSMDCINCPVGNSMVIGEFICDRIDCITGSSFVVADDAKKAVAGSCLTVEDAMKYAGKKDVFKWHITNLKIYDTPMPLQEFRKWNECYRGIQKEDCVACFECEIKQPPQSWFYVAENR